MDKWSWLGMAALFILLGAVFSLMLNSAIWDGRSQIPSLTASPTVSSPIVLPVARSLEYLPIYVFQVRSTGKIYEVYSDEVRESTQSAEYWLLMAEIESKIKE